MNIDDVNGGGVNRDRASWEKISRILDEALDLPAEALEAFLDTECAHDLELRKSVEALLAADQESGDFLQGSVAEQAAGLIVNSEEADFQSLTMGPFRTTRLLGSGGMGLVYLAERADGEFEQEVAIKCLRGIIRNADSLKQFLAERQILARLQHPGIAHLLDGGVTENGHPYFAMEYVDGVALTTFCDDNNLGLSDRLQLFLKVCAAVSYAHSMLTIHQDLKPSNILVVDDGQKHSASGEIKVGDLQVKLLDFGIAQFLQDVESAESGSAVAGFFTPEYAAPEQVLNQPISTSTDVYALGLILYQLLSGKLAHDFTSKSPAEVSQLISGQPPIPPSVAAQSADASASWRKKRQRRLRGDLDAIVIKALQKSPEQRFSSVEAMAEDIRRYLNLQPVLARKGSWGYQLGKFLFRYRWSVSVTALVLVLLAGMTVSTLQSNIKIRSSLEKAKIETAKATEISVFLSEIFEVADPFARNGEEISVIELLNRGANRIATDLAGQPQTQSQLMFELARIHNSLGLFGRSSELLEQTLLIQRATFGLEHVDIARSLHWHSIVLDNLGAYVESEEAAEAALSMRLKLLGPQHPDLGESMDRLGSILAYSGQKDRALDLSKQAVSILSAAAGPDDPRTQTARHNLAWMLGQMGRYDEATLVYELVIEVATRLSGQDDPTTLMTLDNFAVMLRRKGDVERAEAIFRQVLSDRLRLLGFDHPQVGFTQNNLAKLLQDREEYAEALTLYQQSLDILRISYGDEHGNVAISLSNIALLLVRLDRLEEAELKFREALMIHRKNSPTGSIKLAGTLNGLGRLLAEQGNIDEAEPLLREALDIQLITLEGDHFDVAESQLRLAQLLISKGEHAEAEDLLHQSHSSLTKQFGDDNKLVRQARESLDSLKAL